MVFDTPVSGYVPAATLPRHAVRRERVSKSIDGSVQVAVVPHSARKVDVIFEKLAKIGQLIRDTV